VNERCTVHWNNINQLVPLQRRECDNVLLSRSIHRVRTGGSWLSCKAQHRVMLQARYQLLTMRIMGRETIFCECWRWYWVLIMGSISSSSGCSDQVQVRKKNKLIPNWQSGWWIYMNHQFRYNSMEITQSSGIGWVVSGSSSGSICRFI
jgi:hypothetical protein